MQYPFHIIKSTDNVIDNVIHISDLHFTMRDKYEHYQNVFDHFIEDIKKYDNSNTIVIITGDLFNEKNKLDSKLVFFSKKLIYNISKLFTTFIICGNHDFIQQNRKIPDTISSVFYDNLYEHDYMFDVQNNLYYLKNTGYYVYENIGFGVLSVFDLHDYSSCGLNENIEFPDGNILHNYYENRNHFNLALLHTTVKNSAIQTHEGYDRFLESYDNHIDVNNIKNYDYILLGDIHKQQFIKNAGYPSSLVQQNFGEDPVNHGYILWDLKNKKYDFIRVYSDYAMIKCKVSIYTNNRKQKRVNIELPLFDKNLKYPTKLELKIVISESELEKFIDEKHSKDDLLKLVKEWFSENNFIITNLEIIFDNPKIENLDEDKIVIDDSVNWLDIKTIEKYIKEFSNDDQLIDEYRKIHELVMIKKIKNDSKNWKLLNLEWSNLFSYGEDNSIDFSKDNINIILGENFTGKSSILDVLIYTIYGSVYRCDKLLQIINVNQKLGYSSLTFQYGNVVYKIERHLKKKITKKNENHSQKIYVKKIVGNDISDIIVNLNSWTGEKLIETPEKIDDFVNEIFGTKNNFLSTYILNQSNNNSFVHMKNTERKELLESWLQLELLEESRKQIKLLKKEKEDDNNKLRGALEQCSKLFETTKSSFDIEKYENTILELRENIEKYENDLKEFENYKLIPEPCIPQILFENVKYDHNFLKIIDRYKNDLLLLRQKIEYVEYDENYHNRTINEHSKLIEDYNSLNKKIQNIQTKINTFPKVEPSKKSIEILENSLNKYNDEIELKVDDYFKDKNNIIPHNRNKNLYYNFLEEYNIFMNNFVKSKNEYIDELNELKLKRKNFMDLNNTKNEMSTNIQLLEQKLKTMNHSFIYNIENIDVFINYTNYELETYWKSITDKSKILNMKINKTDKNIINPFFENLMQEIEKWEKEQSIIKINFKNVILIDILKTDKLKYEKLTNELKNVENNLKTLNKFKFSKTCECCNENANTLKLNKYLFSKTQIEKEISELNNTYTSYEKLIDKLYQSENHDKWIKDFKINDEKNKKLKEQHEVYVNLKCLHSTYLKIKDKLDFFNSEKENIHIYNEKVKLQKQIKNLKNNYQKIEIIDISNLSDKINEIESILQKYDHYDKENKEWNKYVNKFDIYEDMQNKQKNNIIIRTKISDIQKEIRNTKLYEELITLKEQLNYYNNEKYNLDNEKKLLDLNIKNLQSLKQKYIKNKQYQEDVKKFENQIRIMDLKWNQFTMDIEEYNEKYEEYCKQKKIYDDLKCKYILSKDKLIKNKVEIDILQEKYKRYIDLKENLEIKTSESFEINKLYNIYYKLNELMSINGYNYWIYKNIIPILNHHTNNILKNIVDFTCDIELISDSIKSTSIDIYIQNSNNNIRIPIKMSSGFQQQIVSIAIRIALINLSNNKGSSIFMDESFSSFDINYQSKIPELLKYFSKTFDNIWVISHIENLQKDIEGKYVVKRIGLYSKVNKV